MKLERKTDLQRTQASACRLLKGSGADDAVQTLIIRNPIRRTSGVLQGADRVLKDCRC